MTISAASPIRDSGTAGASCSPMMRCTIWRRIMKAKNDESSKKVFYHETFGSHIGNSLFYSGIFLGVLAFILGRDKIFGGFAVITIGIAAILRLIKKGEGYALEEDCIYYKYGLITRKLLFQDIKCIIIANSSEGERIKNTPYVMMMGGDPEKILHFCMNSERFHVLSIDEIRGQLGGEIGYYGPENFWRVFRKGAFTTYDYGVEWNQKEMHKVLEGFSGDYYVASSVVDCWRKKYDEIVKGYGIEENRIHIMDDSTYGIFRW